MSNLIKNIVIVGGGSAGWLTAGIIAAEYRDRGKDSLQVTLIESPEVSSIGVGEGTWPSMRTTLKKIGISETDLIRVCSASFKQGSKFVGWKSGAAGDVYHHPFTIPQGYAESNLLAAWQAEYANRPFAEVVSVQNYVSEHGCAPKQISTPEYAGVVNYGYHLDAGKFGELLQRHCSENLGVTHIRDHVVSIVSASDGDIESISTRESGLIKGDLFIDCTGSNCLLLGQHYRIPFVAKHKYSFNDSAIAAQVPYGEESTAIASATVATAKSAGWTWDIGLSTRRGVGYVYSSTHITHEQAESELRAHIAASIGHKKAEELTTRKLPIHAGYRQKFWHKNCVAIGMSAGFIEPLEASALALVELSANMIRDELPLTRESMDIVSARFNEIFNYRWERIVDFLKLHYVLTQRRDTEYWRDAASPETMSDELRKMLLLWRYRPPYHKDLIHGEEIFPSPSYQYVLYGMGFLPEIMLEKSSDNIEVGLSNIKENLDRARKYLALLPSNRQLIEHIVRHGMPKI